MTSAEPNPVPVPPRPSVVHVVLSVLVMCGSAAVVGIAVALPFVANFAPLVCIIPVTAVSLLVGVNQFLGTFRRWPGSALVSGLAIVFAGILWLFMLLVAVVQFSSVEVEGAAHVALWLSIALGMLLLWAGLLNLLWQVRLVQCMPANEPLPLARFSFRELFLLVTVLAVMLSSTGYLLRQIPQRWGENVKPKQARYDLPVQAERVCFSRSESSLAVEFHLDEAGFRRWVQDDHPHDDRWQTPLQPISTTYEITRYRRLNGLAPAKPIAKINRGLYLECKTSGSWLQVAYDEEAAKVYLYEEWAPRNDP